MATTINYNHFSVFNNMHKFQKKTKDTKKQNKKQAEKVEKKVESDEEEEQPIALNVEIIPQAVEKEKPKVVKVPAKVIDETEIDYEMKNPNEGKTEVRISWVPQQGGVVKKFDYEKEKEHFVAIGEEYTPPVQQKNSNFLPIGGGTTASENKPRFFTNSSIGGGNMAPMEKSAQQLKQEQIQAQLAGTRAPATTKQEIEARKKRQAEGSSIFTNSDGPKKIISFTKGVTEVNNIAPLQKTKQQLMEEELANQGSFQSTTVSKEEKLAREAERKKRDEQAAKLINFNSGEKKVPNFTSNTGANQFGGLGHIQKTPQQLAEERIEEQIRSKNLASKTLTREQIEQKKARQLEKQREDEKRNLQAASEIKISSGGPIKFFNSSKPSSDSPQFIDLK